MISNWFVKGRHVEGTPCFGGPSSQSAIREVEEASPFAWGRPAAWWSGTVVCVDLHVLARCNCCGAVIVGEGLGLLSVKLLGGEMRYSAVE